MEWIANQTNEADSQDVDKGCQNLIHSGADEK